MVKFLVMTVVNFYNLKLCDNIMNIMKNYDKLAKKKKQIEDELEKMTIEGLEESFTESMGLSTKIKSFQYSSMDYMFTFHLDLIVIHDDVEYLVVINDNTGEANAEISIYGDDDSVSMDFSDIFGYEDSGLSSIDKDDKDYFR